MDIQGPSIQWTHPVAFVTQPTQLGHAIPRNEQIHDAFLANHQIISGGSEASKVSIACFHIIPDIHKVLVIPENAFGV